MEVLLVLNDGLRVVVKLYAKTHKEEFAGLLGQGRKREAIDLLKSKAEVRGHIPQGKDIPMEFKPVIMISERE
jgi:hypothetical protein